MIPLDSYCFQESDSTQKNSGYLRLIHRLLLTTLCATTLFKSCARQAQSKQKAPDNSQGCRM